MFEDVRIAVGGGANSKRPGFTLAEVLITLGIIGVVAAITMPVLITNVQDRVKQKRVENIKQKLSKVTDAMAATSGINGYSDTMAFVQEMNKHMKIAKICDNSNLSACWGTKDVTISKKGKTWEISKTKDAKSLLIPKKVRKDWSDTVGIVTADGTPMILSYNKNCDFNPDVTGYVYSNGLSNSTACLTGAFDWNGGKKPNKLGDDVMNFGVAMGLGVDCSIEIGGKCFSAPFIPTPLTSAECNEQKSDLGIATCSEYDDNYWAGGIAKCGGIDNFPSAEDLAMIASELYGKTIGAEQDIIWTDGLRLNTSKATSFGFTSVRFALWSNQNGKFRYFDSTNSGFGIYYPYLAPSSNQAMCVSN